MVHYFFHFVEIMLFFGDSLGQVLIEVCFLCFMGLEVVFGVVN